MSSSAIAVSRKAERKVKDRLPIPETCPYCGSAVSFVNNAEIYGRAYGDWPWAYKCDAKQCGVYVGTHPNTKWPLGTLATAEVRAARMKTKNLFNPLWQSGQMSRSEAYAWLATKMGITVAACHFGWFDAARCEKAIAILGRALTPAPKRTVKDFAALRQMMGGY